MMVSPSLRNLRASMPYSRMSFFPPSDISSKLPYSFGLVPLMVPDAIMSPVRMGQPPRVWWASI